MEVHQSLFILTEALILTICEGSTTQSSTGCMSYPCTGLSTCVPANNDQGYMCCDYVSNRYINSTGHLCFPCDTNPCGDDGTCQVDGSNSYGYFCECPDGTTAQSCTGSTTQSSKGCMSYPCTGLSTCVPANNDQGYMCCDYVSNRYINSTGHLCFPCDTNPCGDDGTCQVDGSNSYGYFCECPDGTTAQSCTGPTTHSGMGCMSYPCTGLSTCVSADNEQGYMCCEYVSNRYINSTGHLCFPCDTDPCGNDGTCQINGTNAYGYFCHCPDGTTGHSCTVSDGSISTVIQDWKLLLILVGTISSVIVCILVAVIIICFVRRKHLTSLGKTVNETDFKMSDTCGRSMIMDADKVENNYEKLKTIHIDNTYESLHNYTVSNYRIT